MLNVQCTIHSGLRMPGYQSADVYLWSEDPGSHKHDPSCLGGHSYFSFGGWCWHEANSLSVLIYPDLACQLALTKTILHKTANGVNCFGQAAFKPFSRSAAYEAANACGFTKGITLQVPLM